MPSPVTSSTAPSAAPASSTPTCSCSRPALPKMKAGIEADPILSSLPAVTEGRSLFVEGSDYDALQFVSALPYLLENLIPKLAALAG